MYCNKCGNQIDSNTNFCNKCGNPINNTPSKQSFTDVLASIKEVESPVSKVSSSQNEIQNNIEQNVATVSNQNEVIGNQNITMEPQNNIEQSVSMVPNQSDVIGNQNITMEPQNNIGQSVSMVPNQSPIPPVQNYNNFPNYYVPPKNNRKSLIGGLCIGLAVLFIVFIIALVSNGGNDYYFEEQSNNQGYGTVQSTNSNQNNNKYSTAIIYDNTYSGMSISNSSDAIELIVKDSVSQKSNCPSEIKSIEDGIIDKYGVNAVNLCEMDLDFAREIDNVFKKVYDEFPGARGHLTNLTLVNVSLADDYIAAFQPFFKFATSNSSSTYPWVIKTQVLLNTRYFLNRDKMSISIKSSSNSGHFPKNATLYSPVAHELGHYLSFLAASKYYGINSVLVATAENIYSISKLSVDSSKAEYSLTMIKEAYERYQRDTNDTIDFDEWRGTISKYALAKNNKGQYLYDETIAESFHDVYLNGDNAATASKYVVNILKEKLNG